MDTQALQLHAGPPRRGPDWATLIKTRFQLREIMNFGCARWRIQDELWGMTQNECEEEEDGYSLVLSSSNKTASKYKQRAS
jgi:hypothetical protein